MSRNVLLTAKDMPNGETRWKTEIEGLGAHVTFTETTVGGWQNAHYHKGLLETYVVIRGGMVIMLNTPHEPRMIWRTAPLHPDVTLGLGDSHNIFLSPNTLIATVVYGVPVGNPDRDGNDWWPADENFDRWTKSLSEKSLRDGSWKNK